MCKSTAFALQPCCKEKSSKKPCEEPCLRISNRRIKSNKKNSDKPQITPRRSVPSVTFRQQSFHRHMHQPYDRCSEKVGHSKAERLYPRHKAIREARGLSLDECIAHTRQLVNILVMTVAAMVFCILATTIIMAFRLHAATVFFIGIIIERRRKLRHTHIARVVTLHESNPATHQYDEQRKQYAIEYDAKSFHLIY